MNSEKMLELCNKALSNNELSGFYLEELKKIIVADINGKKQKASGKQQLCKAFERVEKSCERLLPNRLDLHKIVFDSGKTVVTDGHRCIAADGRLDGLEISERPDTYIKAIPLLNSMLAEDYISVTLPQPAEIVESITVFKENKRNGKYSYLFDELKEQDKLYGINPEYLKDMIAAGVTELRFAQKSRFFIGTDAEKTFTYAVGGIHIGNR